MRIQSRALVLAIISSASFLGAQTCVDVSTGFDEEAGLPIDPGLPDDDYTVDLSDGSLGAPPAAVVEEDGFPIPPWVANTAVSKWIGFPVADSNSVPGTYMYEARFDLPPGMDAAKAVLIGGWAADDGSAGFEVNGTFVASPSDGFGVLKRFPAGAGLGLFVTGENTLRFQVVNGGEAANPTGLRVEACIGVPVAVDRPFDLSTGFSEATKLLLGDGAADDEYRVTGPPGSGITDVAARCVTDDDAPIPPWAANSVNSRWIGLDGGDSVGPAGTYSYKVQQFLLASFEAPRGILRGSTAGADRLEDVLVNGTSIGFTATDPAVPALFAVDAGQGLFRTGANTIEFLVAKDAEGSTGLRVDAEVALGPEIPNPATSVLALDTGFDEAAGATIANGLADDSFVILGPPGSGIGPALATVVNDDVWPIVPGVWVLSTARSKWLAGGADSNAPAGTFTYRVTVTVPPGRDPAEARLVGSWAVDDAALDVRINGVSAGIPGAGGFAAMTAFPPAAGQGLFVEGDNQLEFLVSNGGGPTGLRVEAVVGFEEPRPRDLSTGIDVRGIGPVSPGAFDPRYRVTGPAGSEIADRQAVVVPADGNPIPPWAANSSDSQWIGLDGADSTGPAGTYTYRLTFVLDPAVNPFRAALAGSWAAAGSGTDVLLNGSSLGIAAAGPGALVPFPARAGKGLFVLGTNTLEFIVESPAGGSTGLRVEARLETIAEPNPFDISTGFDQAAGQLLLPGDQDPDYIVTDPSQAQDLSFVVLGPPVPPWIPNGDTSLWIGGNTGLLNAPPGQYAFETTVNIATDAEAASARLSGAWATDDRGDDVLVNGIPLGLINDRGYGTFTLFPEDAGRGFFVRGTNTIQFQILNAGTTDNPVGLRVDAVVEVTTAGAEVFRRGDADGKSPLNITDPIYVLNALFAGGPPVACPDTADADDSGGLNITDPIRILNFLFAGGELPGPPGPTTCGPDPTPDALGPCEYSC
jgi:hypothetical protein